LVFLCRAVIDNCLESKRPLNFPDASDEEREAAVSRRFLFSSKFKGVSLITASGKWQAMPTIGGEQKYLGLFENERDAALACDRHSPANHPS
jgi:hypothetical protein